MLERLTPRQAAEISTADYTQHKRAAAAVEHAHSVIEQSTNDAADPTLDERRRAIGTWHVKWWTSHELPEREKELEKSDKKAARHHKNHQSAYYDAARAEALLDGVDI